MNLTPNEEVELLLLLELEAKEAEKQKVEKALTEEQQRLEIEKQRCLEDELYYLTNYAYIEDKTNPTGISLFDLWPEQIRALETLNKEQFVIAGKSRQIGITWLVLEDTLHKMLKQSGYTAIAISKRDKPDAIELSKRQQLTLRHLPKWLTQEAGADKSWTGLRWRANDHEVIIERPDGEASRFMTLPASPDTAHSFTANRIILDEWALHPFAEDIWTGAFPTMNRVGFSGQVIGLSTGRPYTLFERIWKDATEGKNRFKKIFLNVWADPRRTREWFEQTKKDLPITWRSQYPETEEDLFATVEGTFFTELSAVIHIVQPFPIPEYWKKIRCMDYGLDMLSCQWIAFDEKGNGYVYRAISGSGYNLTTAAKLILKHTPLSEDISYTVASPDLFSRPVDRAAPRNGRGQPEKNWGVPEVETMIKAGLKGIIRADNRRIPGWREVREWITPYEIQTQTGEKIWTARLKFFNDDDEVLKVYSDLGHLLHDEHDYEDCSSEPHEITHRPEGLRYGLMSRPPRAVTEAERQKREYDRQQATRPVNRKAGY